MEAANSEKKIILAIDDLHTVLESIRIILKNDYQVITAKSATQAEECLKQIKPDLILLDIEMPVMDGFSFLQRLRADGKNADIPVIFVTAHASPDIINRAMEAGVDGYVIKPFIPDALKRRIRGVLERN
ncbi:MAG: response regulator [Treponema sp.]|jgi:DNA-binding response OmpR family regulator|nr:response regulator [Treponema sp.]